MVVTARTRRLVVGIVSSLFSRGIALLAPIILIPFALNAIGAERYGLWTTIAALTSMAMFTDLGLGNGLMTRLSATYANGDTRTAASLTASAYLMTGAIAAVLVGGIVTLGVVFEPASLVDARNTVPTQEVAAVFVVCLTAFAVNIPVSLIVRVQYAYQQVGYSNVWMAAGSLLSVASFMAVAELGGSAVACIAASVWTLPAVGLVNTAFFYAFQRRDLSPLRGHASWRSAKSLLRLGGLFFLLSTLTSIAINIDPLLISRVVGLAGAAEYSIGWRVAGSLGILVSLVNLPLWPANGEALARGDTAWVRRATLRMTLLSALLVAACGAILLGPGSALVATWLGEPEVQPSPNLMILLVAWNVLLAATSPALMVQNSVGLVWPQLLAWSVFLFVGLPLKWWAILQLGTAGGVAVAVALYASIVIPLAWFGMAKALDAARSRGSTGGEDDALVDEAITATGGSAL